MKTIEIVISPTGETRVETKGFVGDECKQASRFVESALGSKSGETLTAEFYGSDIQQHNHTKEEQ